MFRFKRNSRLELLKSYKLIVEKKGNIPLKKLLMKRLPLYIGLGILFLCGFFVACWPPSDPMMGGVMTGVAGGAFVADVSFVAALQRALALNYKFIDAEAVEQELMELKQSRDSGKTEKSSLKLQLSYLVFFALIILVFALFFFS